MLETSLKSLEPTGQRSQLPGKNINYGHKGKQFAYYAILLPLNTTLLSLHSIRCSISILLTHSTVLHEH